MKSHFTIITLASIFLSLSPTAEARVEISDVDPENYVSKEVAQEVAEGGIRKLHDQGVLKFKNASPMNKPKKDSGGRNLRSLQQSYLDDYYYYSPGSGGLDDDQLVGEETITIEYYQDNRFSSPDPIYSNPLSPAREDSGNRWLYANVPLQPIFGINDLPIQGLAQGYCESLLEDQDGFCHFTYEFFDLRDGAIVVYASITVEGATAPQGPSTLNIVGGTGEFQGAVGEVVLLPVGIDESIIPARIFRDGSLFLGNMNGYEAHFNMSVRYLINAPMPIPVPVSMPIPAPVPVPQVVTQSQVAAGFATRVTCPGQIESEYCDCDLDCGTTSERCKCEEADACCEKR